MLIACMKTLRIIATPPAALTCGKYVSNISIFDSTGMPILGGDLQMDYTRTWEEFTAGPPPRQLQVYRFAVKIDMEALGSPGSACSVPSCLSSLSLSIASYGAQVERQRQLPGHAWKPGYFCIAQPKPDVSLVPCDDNIHWGLEHGVELPRAGTGLGG
jgi:hypothetical protein